MTKENNIEQNFINKLIDQKYTYRPDIRTHDALNQNFRQKFQELNFVNLSDAEFSRVLDQIITSDLFSASKRLREHGTLERDDGTPLHYTLLNLKDWCKNSFEVINQLRMNTQSSYHRYDVILLINGIPLVQVELKTLEISPRRAMQQIIEYKNDAGNGYTKTLLSFMQLFIVSNQTNTYYFAELTSSKRVHLSDYVPVGIPFFRGKEISLLRNGQVPEDILFISEEYYEEIREKCGVPQIGDILIKAVGTLGNVYCVQNLSKFYFKDGNLIWMKNIVQNPRLLEILLNVKKEDIFASAIGSSQKALTIARLNKLSFAFPILVQEQQKIADCLSSIDELITASSKKVETLKEHKKGLMQKLFPTKEVD